MVRTNWWFVVCLALLPGPLLLASPKQRATKVLEAYLEASGGIDQILAIEDLTVQARQPLYEREITAMYLLDGRGRVGSGDDFTLFDGERLWRSFYGMVEEVPLEDQDADSYSLLEVFFHGLVDATGKTDDLEYRGKEVQHGQRYYVLAEPGLEALGKTYYFDAKTGLLDKIVEVRSDPELKTVKTVHRFWGYRKVGPVTLFTGTESTRITTGDTSRPDTELTEFAFNTGLDKGQFTRPVATAPEPLVSDGEIHGQVVGFSPRGSAITNVKKTNISGLKVEDGAMVTVELEGVSAQYRYLADLQASARSIEQGELVLVGTDTPSLWLVKAYHSLKDEVGVDTGDTFIVKKAPLDGGEEVPSAQPDVSEEEKGNADD